MPITATLQYFKSTKGTHVYQDRSKNAPVPTLYIKRAALPDDESVISSITIIIEQV